MTVKISVQGSEADILEYIETQSGDFARVQALAEYPSKLNLPSAPVDLIGLNSEKATALLPRLEKVLKGIDMKAERMGLVLGERNAVIIAGSSKMKGALIIDVRATADELSEFATKGFVAKRRASAVFGDFRKSVTYNIVL